nr:G patch domain-containing protein 4-like [Lytechinus pictus]
MGVSGHASNAQQSSGQNSLEDRVPNLEKKIDIQSAPGAQMKSFQSSVQGSVTAVQEQNRHTLSPSTEDNESQLSCRDVCFACNKSGHFKRNCPECLAVKHADILSVDEVTVNTTCVDDVTVNTTCVSDVTFNTIGVDNVSVVTVSEDSRASTEDAKHGQSYLEQLLWGSTPPKLSILEFLSSLLWWNQRNNGYSCQLTDYESPFFLNWILNLGKGLGRTETGISDAIKPKLKFDKAGIGHDVGEQFSFHWWDHVFNQAAKNIHVENTEEGVQVKKGTKSTLISNKRSTHENKKKPTLLYGAFVKRGTLNPDGAISQAKDSTSSSDESDDENDKPPETYEGNDEMLFKACGGRTAHKGARHGLLLSGKLQRIEQQENYHSKQVNKKERKGLSAPDEMETVESSRTKKKRKKKMRRDGLMDTGGKDRLEEEMEGDEDDVEKIQRKKKKKKTHKETNPESLEDTPVHAINEDGMSSSVSSSGVGLKENDDLCPAYSTKKKRKKGKKSKLRMNVEIVEGETHNDNVSNEGTDADRRRRKKKAKKEKRKVEMDRDVENSETTVNRKGHRSSGRKDRSENDECIQVEIQEVKIKKKDVVKSGKRRKQAEDEEAFNASSVNQGHDKYICNGVSKKKKKRKSNKALLGS